MSHLRELFRFFAFGTVKKIKKIGRFKKMHSFILCPGNTATVAREALALLRNEKQRAYVHKSQCHMVRTYHN